MSGQVYVVYYAVGKGAKANKHTSERQIFTSLLKARAFQKQMQNLGDAVLTHASLVEHRK